MSQPYQVEISWEQYQRDMQELAYNIDDYRKNSEIVFNKIFPIIRGGLVIGVSLSHLLGIPLLDFSLTKIQRKRKSYLLITDDCSDSGNTLAILTKILSIKKIKYKIATLYTKIGTRYIPHFSVRQYSHDVWIKFPWEGELDAKKEEEK